jgi:hypothetical protein
MAMHQSLPHSATRQLPQTAIISTYRRRMESESKKIVRENVLALLRQAAGGELPPNESGVTRLKNLGLSHGNAQRAIEDSSDLRLGTVDQLAKAFNLKSWQILVPRLNVASPPELAQRPWAGPFNSETMARLQSLDSDGLRKAENMIRAALDMDPLPRPGNQEAA